MIFRAGILVAAGIFLLSGVGTSPARAEAGAPCLECHRRQRKEFEAMQAWRRSHDGAYPLFQKDLEEAGLLPRGGAVCPAMTRELLGGSSAHNLVTARGKGRDPKSYFEYELAPEDFSSDAEGSGTVVRRELKLAMLRRPYWEQIPVLRCPSHRGEAPAGIKGPAFRNFTAEGRAYWSGEVWEKEWIAQVPLFARGGRGLDDATGPPFHGGMTPPAGSLDLRPWVNARGGSPWWWSQMKFIQKGRPPDLRRFLAAADGGNIELAGDRFWVDGIVQLQGATGKGKNGDSGWSFPNAEAFPYERKNLAVGRTVRRAAWLQGTVWSATGDALRTASLIWRYEDGTSCEVPVDYLRNVWRFASDVPFYQSQLSKPDFTHPVWTSVEEISPGALRPEFQISVWKQVWENPRPEVPVATLDLIGNRECSAGLFLLAISVE